jgi:hypothetical protein
MSDDVASPAPEGTEAPAATNDEVIQQTAPEGGDDGEGYDGGYVGQSPAPALSEEDYLINFLGTDKFTLPKETPEEIRTALKNLEKSLNKGWTEKNMRLADERRQVLAERENVQAEIEAERATLKELAAKESLQSRVDEYDKVDWVRWAQTDPSAAQAAWMAAETDRRQLAKLSSDIEAKQGEQRQKHQQAAESWLRQSTERLQSEIKDWSPDKGKAIAEFVARSYLTTDAPTMDRNALQAVAWHPGLMKMAHDAMQYQEVLKRASTKPVTNTTPAVPVPKVAGVAPVAKDPDKMTDKEWMAWRNADQARKRAAAAAKQRR